MRFIYCLLITIFVYSCHVKSGDDTAGNTAIPAVRKEVSSQPVASYLIPIGDRRLDRKFGVEVYETPRTFKYLLAMKYDALEETDTLTVPNFDTWPVVQVKPGKDSLSCIIGFLDDKKQFLEYKLLSAENNQLKLTVLRRFAVSR